MGLDAEVKKQLRAWFPAAFMTGLTRPVDGVQRRLVFIEMGEMLFGKSSQCTTVGAFIDTQLRLIRRWLVDENLAQLPTDLVLMLDKGRFVTRAKHDTQQDRSSAVKLSETDMAVRHVYKSEPDRLLLPPNLHAPIEERWIALMNDRELRRRAAAELIGHLVPRVKELLRNSAHMLIVDSLAGWDTPRYWSGDIEQARDGEPLESFANQVGEAEFLPMFYMMRLRELAGAEWGRERSGGGPVWRVEINSSDGDLLLIYSLTYSLYTPQFDVVIRSANQHIKATVTQAAVDELPEAWRRSVQFPEPLQDDDDDDNNVRDPDTLGQISVTHNEFIYMNQLAAAMRKQFGGDDGIWSFAWVAFFMGSDLCDKGTAGIGAGTILATWYTYRADIGPLIRAPDAAWQAQLERTFGEHSSHASLQHLLPPQDLDPLWTLVHWCYRTKSLAVNVKRPKTAEMRACSLTFIELREKCNAKGKVERHMPPFNELELRLQHAYFALLYYALYGWWPRALHLDLVPDHYGYQRVMTGEGWTKKNVSHSARPLTQVLASLPRLADDMTS